MASCICSTSGRRWAARCNIASAGLTSSKVRDYSQKLGNIVATNPHLDNVTFDWNEPSRTIKVEVLQDKARLLGVSSQDISSTLNSVVAGSTVTQLRDDIYLIDVIGQAQARGAHIGRNAAKPAIARRRTARPSRWRRWPISATASNSR